MRNDSLYMMLNSAGRFVLMYVIVSLFFQKAIAQQKLPIIRSSSVKVDIKDGDDLQKAVWNLSPANKPDICYVSVRSGETKFFGFYTDIDSITFNVKPGDTYDFVILLNNKDSCYTRVSTFMPRKTAYRKNCNGCIITYDTIPFHLGTDNRIHLTGKINDSESLDFVFDTGADRIVLSKSGFKKVKEIKFNGTVNDHGVGGTSTVEYSAVNTLQIDKLIWDSIPVIYNKGETSDGVVGRNVFEDKIVEFDYDKKIMIVYSSMPDLKNSIVKLHTKKRSGGFLIEATLVIEGKEITDWFSFDSGNSAAFNLNSHFSEKNGLPGNLKIIGTDVLRGNGPNGVKIETVLLPKLKIGDFEFINVPTHIEIPGQSNEAAYDAGFLGNALLKRLNVILDYQTGSVYAKMNTLVNSPFPEYRNKKTTKIIIISVVIFAFAIAAYILKRRDNAKTYNNLRNKTGY